MINKKVLIAIPLILLNLNGCNNNENESSLSTTTSTTEETSSSQTTATFTKIHKVSYNEVNVQKDMDKFYNETKNAKGSSNDNPLDYGFVKSVWHELKINNEEINVYSARCGYGIHSFAWIDVETDGDFTLDIDLTLLSGSYSKVTVLPEKENVKASINGSEVSSKITSYGNFSFVFDELPYMAMTLYVAPYSKAPIISGYETVTINPGVYDNIDNSLEFKNGNTIYVFKSGVYDITSINVPSDSVIYFERGCYFRVFEGFEKDYKAAITSTGNNVKIEGRALFDFSKCMGGDNKTKGVYSFSGENIHVEGLITINSNNWSLCFNAAKKAEVERCMFFSYRTYSDGVMFSDSQDCVARDCFVRTGDDAMEVKAFSTTSSQTNNVLFENNSVWTDKGIAYGCIYESVHDVENVYFKNNSVGFAQASWSEHLGCLVIQMGSMKQSTWHDVYFENVEIYKTSCSMISLYNRALNATEGGKIKDIYFKNVVAKYVNVINLPVYGINIVIRLGNGADFRNSVIGNAYIDNCSFEGTLIDEDNYKQFTNIALDDNAKFSTKNIIINSLA